MVLILSISLNNASIIMANKPVIKSNHKNIDWLRIWQLWSLKKRHTSFYFLGTSVSSLLFKNVLADQQNHTLMTKLKMTNYNFCNMVDFYMRYDWQMEYSYKSFTLIILSPFSTIYRCFTQKKKAQISLYYSISGN